MINYRGLSIPHTVMGRVTSDNLFDPNEQVIFDLYEAHASRYRRAVDVGANIGVHSILMARQGWEVRAFEPDPVHFAMLRRNLAAHGVVVDAREAAVSNRDGVERFARVLDNTTSSHLEGDKAAYGPVERILVCVVDFRPLCAWADFVKMDCEGHEAALVESVPPDAWWDTDAVLEVGSTGSARRIYEHLIEHGPPMWAQRIGWGRVHDLADMPAHHSHGSLFIGRYPPFFAGGRG